MEGPNPEALRDAVDLGAGLRLLRHADRVTIVLDEEHHRQFLATRPIERLEEFSFAGGALAG